MVYCYSCGSKTLPVSKTTIYLDEEEQKSGWVKKSKDLFKKSKDLYYIVCPRCKVLYSFGRGSFEFAGQLTDDFYAVLVNAKLAEG